MPSPLAVFMDPFWVMYPAGLLFTYLMVRTFGRIEMGGYRDGRLRDYERGRRHRLLPAARELLLSDDGVDVFVASAWGPLSMSPPMVVAPGVPPQLAIEPAWPGHPGVRTGDAAFDESVCVRGDPRAVRALLGSELRSDLRHLVGQGMLVVDGRVRMPIARFSRWWRVDLKGRQVARVHRRLTEGWSQPRRSALRALARHDPDPDVRRTAIEELCLAGAGSGERRKLLRALARDTTGHQRLELAAMVDDRRTWIRVHDDPREAAAVRAAALEGLARLPPGVGADVLARARMALRAPSGSLRRAALVVAASPGGEGLAAGVRDALHEALDTDHPDAAWLRVDGQAQRRAAEVLAAHGTAEDAAWLARRLQRVVPDALDAVLHTVAEHGTLAEVEPLLAFAEGAPAEQARWVQQTVARLQAEVSHVESGRLSLAADEAGALSLADEVEGRLSVADEAL